MPGKAQQRKVVLICWRANARAEVGNCFLSADRTAGFWQVASRTEFTRLVGVFTRRASGQRPGLVSGADLAEHGQQARDVEIAAEMSAYDLASQQVELSVVQPDYGAGSHAG